MTNFADVMTDSPLACTPESTVADDAGLRRDRGIVGQGLPRKNGGRLGDGLEIEIGCQLNFVAAQHIHGVLMVEPHLDCRARTTAARLEMDGVVLSQRRSFIDSFGNTCRRFDLPPGQHELAYSAHVSGTSTDRVESGAAESPVSALPSAVLPFLLPSRYCESDALAPLASQLFGAVEPGWARAQRIVDWVHGYVEFGYQYSSTAHSALSIVESGKGVCRDFAHAAIALCRAMSIPARYVFGYLPDIGVPDPATPMDFCAWCEVFLGGEWLSFDPRHNEPRTGRVVVGRGRDAADVSFLTTFGSIDLTHIAVVAQPAAPPKAS